MLGIVDSGANYAYEVHQYLDGDSSGNDSACTSTTIGSERLAAFTDQLNHLKSNASVWLGWTWWAAGPWWGDYPFTLEPSNGFRHRPGPDELAHALSVRRQCRPCRAALLQAVVSFMPTTPRITSAIDAIWPQLSWSSNTNAPKIATPTAPMPVHTA